LAEKDAELCKKIEDEEIEETAAAENIEKTTVNRRVGV